MQEAVLQLIEVQLAQEEVTESPLGGDENAQLHASGYYALFVFLNKVQNIARCHYWSVWLNRSA